MTSALQGIAIWGGQGFQQISKFEHNHVQDCFFSPEEKYIVTVSETESKLDMVVWDAKQAKPLRALSSDKVEGEGAPILQWGYNDKYIAQIGSKSAIYVYELPHMKLKDDRSFKAEGVKEFFWSPTDNIIAYWVPENGNSPARVALIDVETRQDIRMKNLFHVSDIKIHWSPTGDYCAVKVTRHTKSKKTFTVNFEIFRVREEMVPVETLEMKDHEVAAFAWEPKGNRFALCHKPDKDARFEVSFYTMIASQKVEVKGNAGRGKKTIEKEVREITLLYTLKDRLCNHLYWNPNGQYIVLAGLHEVCAYPSLPSTYSYPVVSKTKLTVLLPRAGVFCLHL
jgi:translation initiation factor 3 subunit B